jgi:tetratricopeptide (TPR) repeat protein
LNMFHLRTADFRTALRYALRCSALAGTVNDPAAIALAHSILGISLHLNGDVGAARPELEAALPGGPRATTTVYLGFEGRHLAGAILARNLWLQGHAAQAVEHARLAVERAASMDHSLTLCIALIWATSVFLWTGDLDDAEEYVDRLISRAESHSLGPYLAVGRGFRGELAIRRGDTNSGVETLQRCLATLHAAPYELLTTPLNMALVRGFESLGRYAESSALIDDTIEQVQANGDLVYMPELLRVKGGLLLAMPKPDMVKAETSLAQSLELSRRQGARAWELRTATDLAKLMADRGQRDHARELLRPVFQEFTEGFDTADLKAAEGLLENLGR